MGDNLRSSFRVVDGEFSTWSDRVFSGRQQLNHTLSGSVQSYMWSPGEGYYSFDVGGLGEKVEQVEFGDAVAGGSQRGEVGGQGLGRAGDINQRGGGYAAEQDADLGPGASARRSGARRCHD